MGKKSIADGDAPLQVWARPDAFPAKPSDSEFGFFDGKGREHIATDANELAKKIKASRNGIDLVWTPASERLVVPESVSGLHQALRTRRKRGADRDMSDGLRMSAVFGAIMLYTLFAAWSNSGGKIEALYSQQLTGVAALLLLFFGMLPLYEGWKTRRHLAVMANREMATVSVADKVRLATAASDLKNLAPGGAPNGSGKVLNGAHKPTTGEIANGAGQAVAKEASGKAAAGNGSVHADIVTPELAATTKGKGGRRGNAKSPTTDAKK